MEQFSINKFLHSSSSVASKLCCYYAILKSQEAINVQSFDTCGYLETVECSDFCSSPTIDSHVSLMNALTASAAQLAVVVCSRLRQTNVVRTFPPRLLASCSKHVGAN